MMMYVRLPPAAASIDAPDVPAANLSRSGERSAGEPGAGSKWPPK
jgi:hypothetical protein